MFRLPVKLDYEAARIPTNGTDERQLHRCQGSCSSCTACSGPCACNCHHEPEFAPAAQVR